MSKETKQDEAAIVVAEEQVKEVSVFEKNADALEIKTNDDLETAAELLGSVKKLQKSLKTKEDDAKRPFLDTLNGIRDAYKPINKNLSAAESTIKSKVIEYRKVENERIEAEKERIEKRVGQGSGKYKPQTAINKISDAEQKKPEGHVATANSSMSVRVIKKVRITNESLIPRDYLTVDTTKLKAAAVKIYDLKSEGVEVKQIPGVEVYTEESIGAR